MEQSRTVLRHFKNREFSKLLALYARETRSQIDEAEYLLRQETQATAMTNLGTLVEDFHVVEEKIAVNGIEARVPVYLKMRRIRGESVVKVRRFDLRFRQENGDWYLLEFRPARGLPD